MGHDPHHSLLSSPVSTTSLCSCFFLCLRARALKFHLTPQEGDRVHNPEKRSWGPEVSYAPNPTARTITPMGQFQKPFSH